MRRAEGWRDFGVIDASGGEKLERWGDVTLIRPDPQVIWSTPRGEGWRDAVGRTGAKIRNSRPKAGCRVSGADAAPVSAAL